MKQRQTRPTQNTAGTMDLEALDAWFERLKPAAKVDGVSMLDGYLTAIIVGPRSISPDEWFFDLLGARGNIGTAQGKTLKAIMAVVERFNTISETLSTTPQKYAPIFHRTDDGTVFAGPWCMGFLAAMQLRWTDWKALRNLDHVDHGLLLPILLHCTDELGRPYLGPPRPGPDTAAFLKNAYHDIPLVVPEIREFYMEERYARP
jgi:uncharacterized protein